MWNSPRIVNYKTRDYSGPKLTLESIYYELLELHLCIKYRNLPSKGAGLASSEFIDWGESGGSQLSNGGFGLKTRQLLKKVCVFCHLW